MKKNTFLGFGFAVIAIGMVSCGKSTTGKIANNWTVVSSEENRTSLQSNGDKDYTHTSFTETTISTHHEQTSSGVTTIQESSGKVSANTINIKKDGTWIWNKEWYYEGEQNGMLLHTDIKTIQSGTWNFVAKTKGDDFKKNERIALNVLKESNSVFQKQDQVLVSSNGSETTFAAGGNMWIYTIVKSKNKELELELEGNYQRTVDGETVSSDMVQSMSLKEK
ncbi:hypothetical protein [Fluviicola sp.]|uniref:hypothetical protein n=1 Tax=Fluviicola sp. TaxID=1917219 RepID=UPI0031D53F17